MSSARTAGSSCVGKGSGSHSPNAQVARDDVMAAGHDVVRPDLGTPWPSISAVPHRKGRRPQATNPAFLNPASRFP